MNTEIVTTPEKAVDYLKSTSQYGAERKAAEQWLKTLKADEERSYAAMKAANGMDPQHPPGSSVWRAARKTVEKECHFKIATINGKGIKRLTPKDTIKAAQSDRKKVRNANRRGLHTLRCVDQKDLSPDEVGEVNGLATAFGLGKHITHGNQVRKLVDRCVHEGQQLPLAKTLEMFK